MATSPPRTHFQFPVAELMTLFPSVVLYIAFTLMSVQGMPGGPIFVAIFLSLFAALAFVRPIDLGATVTRWWPLLALPILALISTAWSDVPALTARYAAQLLFTAVLGVHLARLIPPERFLSLTMTAAFIFLILCIAFNRQGPSADGPVLIGLTGSKNQIGFMAQFLLLAAVAQLTIPKAPNAMRIVALLSLPLAAFILLHVRATGALVLAVVGVAVLLLLIMMLRLRPAVRLASVAAVLLVLSPLLLLIPEIQDFSNNFMSDTLGKDATLSGRTYLWERAADLTARRPLFGYGYQAIWVGESVDTIGLLRWANLDDGRQFNFHNTFIEMRVHMGYFGMGVLILTLVATLFAGLWRWATRPDVASMFFFTVFILFFARSFAELILVPFSSYTAVFFAACVYMFPRAQTQAAPSAQLDPSRAMSWKSWSFGT